MPQILGKDGKPTRHYGLPTYGAGWPHDPADLRPSRLIDGKANRGGRANSALDQSTARREGYELGDKVQVVTPARSVTATLTAITTPGLAGAAAGAPLVTFDPATAQLLLLGEPGWTSIGVALQPGQDAATVTKAIATSRGQGRRASVPPPRSRPTARTRWTTPSAASARCC